MARRTIPFTQDAVKRAIMAVKAAGIDVRTISVRPDGTVVINGDSGNNSENELADRSQPHPGLRVLNETPESPSSAWSVF